ncbi:MAG TPA: DUF6151 family protein [Polyangiales bacterium]|nr:DUF6151 family protein [Polyangiales bacterium]
MSRTVSLRCQCGAVRGTAEGISPASDSRAICYCDDCQIYARHLGTPGVLDERGGTDGCLLAPAQVRFEAGADIRCMQLSPKGLFRWYAGCCKTPLGNTMGPGLPVVILLHSCMDHAAGGRTRDEDLGPPKVKMLARFAAGGAPPGAHPKTPLKMFPYIVGHFARTFLKGRGKPNPFWDDHGAPRAKPSMIDRAEREALRAKVHAAAGLQA